MATMASGHAAPRTASHTGPHGRPPAWSMMGRPLAGLFRRLRRRREQRRAARDLLALDDHLLKDIGLQRSEILAAIHTGCMRPWR